MSLLKRNENANSHSHSTVTGTLSEAQLTADNQPTQSPEEISLEASDTSVQSTSNDERRNEKEGYWHCGVCGTT
jgi:hypothetical protein